MDDQKQKPKFLVLKPYHLSRDKARQLVISTLKRYGTKCPKEGWESLKLTWNNQPSTQVSFADLVRQARTNGVVPRLQDHLDKQDSVFGGTLGEFATPNFQLKHAIEYAGWKKEVQGPCRSCRVERELTEDILYYRQKSCEHSDEYTFSLTARFFRAYLSACVSVVEAFINRHILIAQHEGFTSPEFEKLKAETKLGESVRLWWEVCSDDDAAPFFQSKAWCHFQDIRTKRNELLHAVDPIPVYSMREIAGFLNRVRTGAGKLLLLLRKAHKKPTLGFIERLRTAPLADFQHIRFKADASHEIKRIQGQ